MLSPLTWPRTFWRVFEIVPGMSVTRQWIIRSKLLLWNQLVSTRYLPTKFNFIVSCVLCTCFHFGSLAMQRRLLWRPPSWVGSSRQSTTTCNTPRRQTTARAVLQGHPSVYICISSCNHRFVLPQVFAVWSFVVTQNTYSLCKMENWDSKLLSERELCTSWGLHNDCLRTWRTNAIAALHGKLSLWWQLSSALEA
jgi:hypothetical protein